MCSRRILAFVALAVFIMTSTAPGAAIWWDNGAGDGLWSSPTNWSGDAIPVGGDKVVVDGGFTATIPGGTVPASGNINLGVGYTAGGGGDDGGYSGLGGNGKVIQQAGTTNTKNRLNMGRGGTAVGIYQQDGGDFNSLENTRIGWDNSAAPAPSGIIQNDGNAMHKSLNIGYTGNGAQGFYDMNDGFLKVTQYNISIANGSATGQEGVFTQTGGLVQVERLSEINLGGGVGATGKAILNLDGGTFLRVKNGRNDDLPINFNSSSPNVYINITGGMLRLPNDGKPGDDSLPWALGDLLGIPNNDFRAYGLPADAANYVFTTNGDYTDITAIETATEIIPEPATLLIWSLLAGLGVGLGWRRRRR